jgi:hypothetical protein
VDDDDSVPQDGYPPQTLRKGGRAKVKGRKHGLSKQQKDMHFPRRVKKAEGGTLGFRAERLPTISDPQKKASFLETTKRRYGPLYDMYQKNKDAISNVLSNGDRQLREYSPRYTKYSDAFKEKAENAYNRMNDLYGRAKGYYDTAKKYAPQVEDTVRMISPERADQIKGWRERLGLKKGGRAKGNVYEREMVGEHPSHKKHHFNYQAEMKGEHPSKRKHFAIGGSGKIRHQEMTKGGKPIRHRRNVGR